MAIFEVEKHPTEQIGVIGEEKPILIDQDNTALLLHFLSDIYKNPKRTLMTEYVQNALDSHRLAGKQDTPIRIHLPNKLEPYYKVRDFGVGMTEEDVDGVFRYALRSTKRADADAIGCFGIGKLVFATFSGVMYLTLFTGEEQIQYLIRLQSGDGGITLLSKIPNKEPKGVEIKIPVKEEDFEYFKTTAANIYRFMNPKPEIRGVHDFKFEDVNTVISEELYEVDSSFSDYYSRTSIATIAKLPFEINVSELKSLTYQDQEILNKSLILHFKVGELDIVPSRDALKYTEKTVNAIKNRLEFVKEDLKSHTKKLFESDATTLFAAKSLYYDIFHTSRHGSNNQQYALMSLVLKSSDFIEWNGIRINKYYEDLNRDDYKVSKISSYYHGPHQTTRYEYCENRIIYSRKAVYIFFSGGLSDVKLRRRINWFWYNSGKMKHDHTYFIVFPKKDQTYDEFKTEYGIDPSNLIDIKDFEDPPSKPRIAKNRTSNGLYSKSKVFSFNSSKQHPVTLKFVREAWEEEEVDLENDEGVYVELRYYKPFTENGEEYTVNNFQKILSTIQSRHPSFKIYGFKTNVIEKLGDGWKSLESYIEEIREEIEEKWNDKMESIIFNNILLSSDQTVGQLVEQWGNPTRSVIGEYIIDCPIIHAVAEQINKRIQYKEEYLKLNDDVNYLLLLGCDSLSKRVRYYGNKFYKKRINGKRRVVLKAERAIGKRYPLIDATYKISLNKNTIEYINALNYYRTKQPKMALL